MVFKYIFVFTAIYVCHGQLVDLFVPNLAHSARQFTDILTKQPIVRSVAHSTGNLITSSVDAITTIPLAITRSLGIGSSLPTLIPGSNVVDLTDSIVGDYTAGLGNEDANLSIGDLIIKYGYPLEIHEVVTEDGYVLTMYRIPANGSVAFLMHGLIGSSDDYVVAGPDSGLAYVLAREGYDVWLGNARGNKHSRRHLELSPSQADFWDFSWHEIGYYDLPAMIDYVLTETGEETVKYVGHSQGTTSFFVMASERPEYNRNISVMVALSPVAFMSNVKSPIVRLLSPGGPFFHALSKVFGVYEFLPDNNVMRLLKSLMCGYGPLSEIICNNIMFLIAGTSFGQLNATNLPVVYGHLPSGASAKQFVHYGQGVLSGDFRQFDYGIYENLERYGAEVPPSYALENVQAPVALFYSDADWLSDPSDVDTLHRRLRNTVDLYKVPFEQFNHLDYILARDLKILVNERICKLFLLF